MYDSQNKIFRSNALLFCHCIAAFLVISLAIPWTHTIWEKIDGAWFKYINGSLKGHPYLKVFWALANHKLADWVEDICILTFFGCYIASLDKTKRLQKVIELTLSILYIAAIIYFINRLFFRECCPIYRDSPTLTIHPHINLADAASWLHVKSGSSKSFPGDHGTTALLFAASFTYIAGWRRGIFACLYASFLCLPRMVAGAHWLSDVIVGSGSITLCTLSWIFCTPLHALWTNKLLHLFAFRKKATTTCK